MIKFLLYTALFGVGAYYIVGALPDSFKEKAAAALGLGKIRSRSMEILNPAAQRADLLGKLEENIYQIQNTSTVKSGAAGGKTINVGGDLETNIEPMIKDSEELITQLKELNPKTGVLPGIVGKILGVDQPAAPSESELQKILNQISPETKALICK